MDVADSILGFTLYVAGFLLLLSFLGMLERLWPASKRHEFESDQAEPVAQLVKYENAS